MKLNKKSLKWVILVLIIILFIILLYIVYINKYKLKYELESINDVEINTEIKTSDFVKEIKNGSVIEKNIDTSKLGKKTIIIELKNKLGKIKKKNITININDTISPIIEGNKEEYKITENDEINLLDGITVSDNSKEEVTVNIEGDYDITKSGTYPLKFVSTDSSGNKTEIEFNLVVEAKPEEVSTNNNNNNNSTTSSQININQNSPYYIMVNKTHNVVMVYTKENGEYTKLLKTFICSVGTNTPTGVFNTKKGYEWGTVIGGVFARYSTFIYGDILFHSVPYYRYYDPASLEYEEYNKLGTTASAGCVRLTVEDSKWIFENVPSGTTVYIYNSDTLPSGVYKPTSPKIDINSSNRDWDPTDPDISNPWNR